MLKSPPTIHCFYSRHALSHGREFRNTCFLLRRWGAYTLVMTPCTLVPIIWNSAEREWGVDRKLDKLTSAGFQRRARPPAAPFAYRYIDLLSGHMFLPGHLQLSLNTLFLVASWLTIFLEGASFSLSTPCWAQSIILRNVKFYLLRFYVAGVVILDYFIYTLMVLFSQY